MDMIDKHLGAMRVGGGAQTPNSEGWGGVSANAPAWQRMRSIVDQARDGVTLEPRGSRSSRIFTNAEIVHIWDEAMDNPTGEPACVVFANRLLALADQRRGK